MSRRRKKAAKAQEDISPNLIPMIDIMFLLLLFFMLGADMGQRELEEVRLPIADSVKDDAEAPKDRVTVNVYHVYDSVLKCPVFAAEADTVCTDESHWLIGIRGTDYSRETVKGILQVEADLDRPEKGKPSERRVMIRADEKALYGFVQRVMNACAEVGIYKVEIAAAQKVE